MTTGAASDSSASGPSWKAADVALMLGAELIGDGSVRFSTLGPIETAGPDALTFVRNAKFAQKWPDSKAAAALVSRAVYGDPSSKIEPGAGQAVLVVDDADLAMIVLLEAAAKAVLRAPTPGVHPSAAIDDSATIGEGVYIGPGASVGPKSQIGAGTRLHAGVRIGVGVRIGADCDLRSNAVVEDRCVLGDRVIINPGAVIGGDGFGYHPNPHGSGMLKIPHIGAVELEDDVEIGSNACVDRGKFSNTRIGEGSKIDNLVQIGHNVIIGRGTVICGCTGVGGSTKIGDGVTIGGACAIHDGITIGDGSTLAARSGVMSDVPAGEIYGGVPVGPVRESIKQMASLKYLPDVVRDYKARMRQGAGESEQSR